MNKCILSLLLVSVAMAQAEQMVIDLPAALRLAGVQHSVLAIQLEKLKRAELDVDAAWNQWIPTLRLGAGYTWQDGPLQNTDGTVSDYERNARYAGMGAGANGSALPTRPGLSLHLNLADAIYEPLVAKQRRRAEKLTSEAVQIKVMLGVTEAYYELVSASGHVEIARQATVNSRQLADVTARFAESGEGLAADAERATVEMLLNEQNIELSAERLEKAAIDLARLLRLNDVQLRPAETTVEPLSLIENGTELKSLIDKALAQRPEIRQSRMRLNAERTQLKQIKNGLFIPRVEVGYSNGNFGGGSGLSSDIDGHRDDFYGMLYWQFDHLGFGSRTRTRRQRSRMIDAQIYRQQIMIDVTAEVKANYVEFTGSERRLDIARRAVKSARRALELDNERIFENKGLPLEGLQSMKTLAKVESLYLAVAAKYNMAQVRLLAATGAVQAPENLEPQP
jgi:outer membrane protein TolC